MRSAQDTKRVTFQTPSGPGKFVSSVISKGLPFTDDQFSTTLNSLLDPSNKNGGLDKKKAEQWKTLEWKRASDIYNG